MRFSYINSPFSQKFQIFIFRANEQRFALDFIIVGRFTTDFLEPIKLTFKAFKIALKNQGFLELYEDFESLNVLVDFPSRFLIISGAYRGAGHRTQMTFSKLLTKHSRKPRKISKTFKMVKFSLCFSKLQSIALDFL